MDFPRRCIILVFENISKLDNNDTIFNTDGLDTWKPPAPGIGLNSFREKKFN